MTRAPRSRAMAAIFVHEPARFHGEGKTHRAGDVTGIEDEADARAPSSGGLEADEIRFGLEKAIAETFGQRSEERGRRDPADVDVNVMEHA